MTQKWNNGSGNVFVDYNITSENESQICDISQNTNSHTSINISISSEQQIMIPTQNSFIESSSSIKESCLNNSNCPIPHTTCAINQENLKTDHSTDGKCINHEDSTSQENPSCFVCCCSPSSEKDFIAIKESANYSHAPLLVLLMDVLGYKLDGTNLHAQVVCKSCYQLLDTIDELQQTLTESKTDLRTKFLETIQKLKLKYPRTDKMLKPRCLRCVQMGQINSRKRAKGGRLCKRKGTEEVAKKEKNKISSEGMCSDEEQEDGNELKLTLDRADVEAYERENSSKDSCTTSNDNVLYDTDPVFFSPDERLKAGFIKENEGAQMYVCSYCTAKYDNTLSLKMHVRVYHMPVISYDNGQGIGEARYRIGMKLQNITTNEFSVQEKPFSCLFCLSSYKQQSSLQFHFRENHSPHKPFQCLDCMKRFRQPTELSSHKIYTCSSRKSLTKS